MRRLILTSLLLLSIGSALLICYFRESLPTFVKMGHEKLTPVQVIASEAEMRNALSSRNVVIFAHVNWSAPSVFAKRNFDEFARNWSQRHYSPAVSFYLLDLTDAQQNAPAYVSAWIDSDSRLSGLPVRGSGDVFWLKDGILQEWISAYDADPGALATRTEHLFQQ